VPAHGMAYVLDADGDFLAHPRLRADDALRRERFGRRKLLIAGTTTEVPIVGTPAIPSAAGTTVLGDGKHYLATRYLPGARVRLVIDQPEWGLVPLNRGAEARLFGAAAVVGLGVLGLTALASLRVMKRYDNLLESINLNLEEEISQRLGQLLATRHALIFGLAKLADYRDTDTGAHLERICTFSALLAGEVRAVHREIDDEWIERLRLAASLHDIGKVGIPDCVLLKPGKLTPEERRIMERHSTIGADTLAAIREKMPPDPLIDMGIQVAHEHHEKWDGTGYPRGLRAGDISLAARIVALADFYDAVTSKRVYKDAMTHEEARALILSNRGTHFDPDVVDAFERMHEQFRVLRARLGASEATMGIARRMAA